MIKFSQTSKKRTIKMLRLVSSLLAIAFWCSFTTLAYSERRTALVIGNNDYKYAPELNNPVNDALDFVNLLRELEFEVHYGYNLNYENTLKLIKNYLSVSDQSDISLFFYAGHAVQFQDKNYLIPVDATIESYSSVQNASFELGGILSNFANRSRTTLAFFDACRDNPFLTRSLDRANGGLAKFDFFGNSLVAYAAEPGKVANDGIGENSPFTGSLLKRLAEPGHELTSVLQMVTADVLIETGGTQRPSYSNQLHSPIYLNHLPKSMDEVSTASQRVQTAPNVDILPEIRGEFSNVTLDTQTELKRLGCDIEIDGKWGPMSQAALNVFSKIHGEPINARPTAKVLSKLASTTHKICHSKCEKGQELVDFQCVRAAPKVARKSRVSPKKCVRFMGRIAC